MFLLLALALFGEPTSHPGHVITFRVLATYRGGVAVDTAYMITASPLPLKKPVYASRWTPLLAGVRVRFPVTGTPYPMEGIATDDRRVLVNDHQILKMAEGQ